MTTQQRGPLVAGAILIIIGLAVLVGRQLAFAVDWQVWPIVVGIAIFVVAVVVGGNSGSGLAVLGGIVTMVGVVLAVQRETGMYASWAYAWALVAPGGVGLGLLLYGLLTGQPQHVRGGFGALVAGIALFLVFFLFFESVLGLDTGIDEQVVAVIVPSAIVGLGLLIVIAAFVAPYFGSGDGGSDRWTSSTGKPASASSTPGAAATPASASDDAAVRSIELGDVPAAEVAVSFAAGRLTIAGQAEPGHLLDGVFRGGVRREDLGPGRVKLSTPADRFWSMSWDRVPFEWRIGLTAEVPLRLSIETGAARTEADLSATRVSDLRVRTGAAESSITLPHAAGLTRVDAQGGAAALRFQVPPGVAATIRSQMAIGSVDIDEVRFPRDTQGGWASPDYAAAANRVELMLQGGLGSIVVR
jgi:hypothetical protein